MSITIALAGNPNCGKTTMFNDLTGQSQYVGNWPGVTVEKKEGKLKGNADVRIMDLPGIYSLSPYTLEEVVSRDYLLDTRPEAILNLVDGSNLERNLYLTTQLMETGIPTVLALNMMDIVRKNGDKIDTAKLSKLLGCPIVETTAVKGQGSQEAAAEAARHAGAGGSAIPMTFCDLTEKALADISAQIASKTDETARRWYAIKLFERDEKIIEKLGLSDAQKKAVEAAIAQCEDSLDDDAESIITNGRYEYIAGLMKQCVKRARKRGELSASDKIDRVVTNRFLALPIFAVIMFVVYFLSITTVGTMMTDFTNEVIVEEWAMGGMEALLESIGTADWLTGLVVEGIIAGVGAVIGFVPQMLVLFFLLAILEDCGYMARVAFIMDRIFRRFGLSGKSFIPMLVGTGCSVPGIMASRTIEQDRDRKMTIMTTSFIPCGAKMPIVALIAGAIFGGTWWVAPSAYFVGMAAVILSGIILKKTKRFAGDPAPFVMELPQYHRPTAGGVLRSTWERGWSFIKKAGTIILLSSIVVWFLASFGFADGGFGMVEDIDESIIAAIGNPISTIFRPLGFGNWQATVATVLGLVAKEEVVGVMGTLYAISGDALELVEEGAFGQLGGIAANFTTLTAYCFLVFNLLCAPCFAAIGAIRREMNNARWTLFAIGYQTVFAYTITLMVYQFGLLISGAGFTVGTAAAVICLIGYLYLLFRKPARPEEKELRKRNAKVGAGV